MTNATLPTLLRLRSIRMDSKKREDDAASRALTEAQRRFEQARDSLEAQKGKRAEHDSVIADATATQSVAHGQLIHARLGYAAKERAREAKKLSGLHDAAKAHQEVTGARYRDASRAFNLTDRLSHLTLEAAKRRLDLSDEMELEESTKPSLRLFHNQTR